MKSPRTSFTILIVSILMGFHSGGCQPHTGYSPTRDQALSMNQELLVKDSSIQDYFEVKKSGIYLYARPEDKRTNNPEMILFTEEIPTFLYLSEKLTPDSLLNLMLAKGSEKKFSVDYLLSDSIDGNTPRFEYGADSLKPLAGLKVAIDPGHIAGDFEMAEMEGKYMKMHASPATSMQPVSFFEANLTLATAHVVRQELEEMGAEVFMTRTEPGHGALGLTYQEWKTARWDSLMQAEKEEGNLTDKDITRWKTQAEDKDIMSRFFTPEDLRERARMVNEFHPHLTLIIHYNVDSHNWEARDEEGFFKPTGQNYLMAFVPGSFMRGELSEPEHRLDFLRLLVSDDLNQSIMLSKAFINQSVRYTGVPIVDRAYPLRYLHNASIYTGYPGIYARNLSLTRMIAGPLCYGESLCQDNVAESKAFNSKDSEIEGIVVSKRVKTIAKAYVKAVEEFAEKEFLQSASSDSK